MNLRKVSIFLVIALAGGLSSPASADLQRRRDPQGDVAGGRLDLRRVGLDHNERRLTMDALFWTGWTLASLEGGDEDLDRAITWGFDSKGGPAVDYGVIVDSEGGKLVAYLLRVNPEGDPTRVGDIKNVQRDGKFVRVRIRKARMDTRNGFVRWAAQTSWRNASSCKLPCYDFRPEQPDTSNPTLLTHYL